jgi:hypothetical protein
MFTLDFPFHSIPAQIGLNKQAIISTTHFCHSLIKSKHKLHILILIISIDPQRRLQQIQLFLQTLRLLPHAPNPALHTADNLIDLLLLFPWQGINKRSRWMCNTKVSRFWLGSSLEVVISVRIGVRWWRGWAWLD